MKELKELALIVNSLELIIPAVNLLPLYSNSKLGSLLKGVVAEQYDNDHDAINDLYAIKDPKKSHGGYRKLKFTLKKRLKDAILLFDERNKKYNDYQKAYYQCCKEGAVVKILLGLNARTAAVGIAQSVLKKAKQFEFTNIAVDMALILRLHYGARLGDKDKFTHYNIIAKKYRHLLELETKAQEVYIELILSYVNSRSPKIEQHHRALQAIQSIEQPSLQNTSYQFQLYYYMIKLMIATTIYDYKNALIICDEAINCFNKKAYQAHVPLQIFYYQQLVCHTFLHQYTKGRQTAEQCLNLISEGSFNWFKYYELYFLLAMHTQNYEDANRIFQIVTRHKRFQFLPDNVCEIWTVFEAYLYYLSTLNKIGTTTSIHSKKGFKLGKFINEILIFSKDKSGVNAAVLIIQILILIAEKRYNETIDRFESTQQYCYRYLKGSYTKRSYIFLKMLLKVIQLGFQKDLIEEKTPKLKAELENLPIEVSNQAMEVEIIPFELLWKYLLDSI